MYILHMCTYLYSNIYVHNVKAFQGTEHLRQANLN